MSLGDRRDTGVEVGVEVEVEVKVESGRLLPEVNVVVGMEEKLRFVKDEES